MIGGLAEVEEQLVDACARYCVHLDTRQIGELFGGIGTDRVDDVDLAAPKRDDAAGLFGNEADLNTTNAGGRAPVVVIGDKCVIAGAPTRFRCAVRWVRWQRPG